ncbi:MAG: Ig-like domain-containing protein, partial [Anaerolineae bacterium]
SFSVESIHFLINGSEYPAEWAAEPWDPGSGQPRVFRAWVPLPTSSPYVVTAIAQDRAGNVGQSGAVTFGVSAQAVADSTPPSLTVDIPTAGSCAIDTVTFAGTASDAGSGLASVEVSADGGITWMPATVSGANWSLDWEVPANTDYVSYPAQVRASDRAGNTTVNPKIVTVDNAYPGGLTPVSFSAPQGSHFDAPTTLTIGWNPLLDGSGQASVRLAVDQATDTIPTQIATGGSAVANLDSAGTWYVHLTAVDEAGNGLTRHYGPWHVGTFGASGVPFASREQSIQIDGFIDVENDEWLNATEFLDDGESASSGHGRQSFYAAWDGSAFYLAWQGAWWTVDGTMWAYLDTGVGGTSQPAGPAQNVTALPFDADYAVMVTGHNPSDGALLVFDGSTWQTQTLEFAHGPSGGTEVRIPLDTSSISTMRLVAFAVDDAGWVWSVFPATNPSPAPADLPSDAALDAAPSITWPDVYQWGDLAGTSDPRDGQPENASVTMVLGSPQASGTAWGPGDTLIYTLDLSNLESDSSVNDLTVGLSASTGMTYQTVSGATCADCSSGDSWQLSIPALPAGGSQHITVTAELASAATLGSLHNVTTTVTLEWNASTLAQGSLTHRVDGQPPSVAVEHLPGQVLAPGMQTIYGTADDGDGAGVGGVQYREPGGSWQAATGTSLWSMDVNVPASSTWQIEVQAYDVHGQASQPLTVTFVVDTTPPTVTLDLPPTLNGDYATIGGTTSDPYPTYGRVAGASVQIDSDTAAWRPASVYATGTQTWRFTWDLPNEDGITHTVRARATDAAKNTSLPTGWQTVLVDTVAPVLTATQVLTQVDWMDYRPGTLTDTVVFTGTASDGGGLKAVSVRVYAPTGESYVETADLDAGTWSYVPTLHTGGLHRLYILAEDVAGNVSVHGPFELHGGALRIYLPFVANDYNPTCEDVFEPDDVAGNASVIAADGTPQQHNFHQAGDVDWVAFDVPDSSV